mgnify:CR=1 FL=1
MKEVIMDRNGIPFVEIEENKLQLDIDLRLYAAETVDAAAYKFTDICYVYKRMDGNDENLLHIVFEAKESKTLDKSTVKQFCNELIDQQVRFNVNKQFAHIRDLIVEEAFKPVSVWNFICIS